MIPGHEPECAAVHLVVRWCAEAEQTSEMMDEHVAGVCHVSVCCFGQICNQCCWQCSAGTAGVAESSAEKLNIGPLKLGTKDRPCQALVMENDGDLKLTHAGARCKPEGCAVEGAIE